MLLSLWQRLPVIVRAVLAGVTVAGVGLLPWVLFVSANQKVLRARDLVVEKAAETARGRSLLEIASESGRRLLA